MLNAEGFVVLTGLNLFMENPLMALTKNETMNNNNNKISIQGVEKTIVADSRPSQGNLHLFMTKYPQPYGLRLRYVRSK